LTKCCIKIGRCFHVSSFPDTKYISLLSAFPNIIMPRNISVMEQKKCYLAVDGGNSKTEYRLLDSSGAVIAAHRGVGSNHETMPGGFDGAAALLLENCEEMLRPRGYALGDVADAVFGLAGADHEQQINALAGCLNARGLKKCFVCNDGYLGVMAGVEDGVGVCYSAGSGVTCAGMNQNGRRVQYGGLGVLSGDTGGGFDIVAFVYRSIYQYLFFGRDYTYLKDSYFTLLDLHSPQEFLASAARIQNPDAARLLIGIFFAAVETGDAVAAQYAACAASHAASCIIAAIDTLALKPPVRIVFSGSILTTAASQSYRRMIQYELIRQKGEIFNLRVNDQPPVDGAVRWVRLRNRLADRVSLQQRTIPASKKVPVGKRLQT
jgi:N-acetylglucosamine kinase-like BadF-type ATPase